jgi:hypothetical protein
MKPITQILAIQLLITTVAVATPNPKNPDWQNQVKKISLGMKQLIVHQYLPPRSSGDDQYAQDGSSYTETYALDDNWSVSIKFDRSGFTENNNPYGVLHMYNDKVIALPKLIKKHNHIDPRPFPPITPKT